jgi:hypothetical protein
VAKQVELHANRGTLVVCALCVLLAGFLCFAGQEGANVRLGLAAVAAFFLLLGIAASRPRLRLDDRGVTQRGLFGSRSISWGEVEYYTFWSADDRGSGAVGGLVSALANAAEGRAHARFVKGALKIFARDGRSVTIDLRFSNAVTALDPAFAHLHSRLDAATDVSVKPFALDSQGLHCRDQVVGLAEIERVIASVSFVVHARGKRFAWATAHMGQVRNSIWLLTQLSERGVVVEAPAGLFVPTCVRDKLTSRSAA